MNSQQNEVANILPTAFSELFYINGLLLAFVQSIMGATEMCLFLEIPSKSQEYWGF
jgi:hypothetical protein